MYRNNSWNNNTELIVPISPSDLDAGCPPGSSSEFCKAGEGPPGPLLHLHCSIYRLSGLPIARHFLPNCKLPGGRVGHTPHCMASARQSTARAGGLRAHVRNKGRKEGLLGEGADLPGTETSGKGVLQTQLPNRHRQILNHTHSWCV